jgi:hypothetical protein
MPRGRPRKQDSMLLKSAEFIGWALGGLEREIAQTRQRLAVLNEQAARLRTRVGTGMARAAAASSSGARPPGGKRKRRKLSPEARKRISEAQTKRWAEQRKAKG